MLDAKLVALDQKTGKVAWSTIVEPWQTGYSITSAPLYYDGMVITGVSGGVMGRRCSIKAYDAKTGKLIWTFYTIPGPNEPATKPGRGAPTPGPSAARPCGRRRRSIRRSA